jgi:hypothetical protein
MVVMVFAVFILLVVAASVITTTSTAIAIGAVVVAVGFLVFVGRTGGGTGGWRSGRMGN